MSVPTTMIDWASWQKALSDWAASAGVPIIWAAQSDNAPQPKRPFIMLQVMSVERIGFDGAHDTITGSRRSIQREYYGQRRLTLTVQCFAWETGRLNESAVSYLEALRDNLDRQDTIEALDAAGLAWTTTGRIANLAEIEGGQFIGRASMDVVFEGAANTPSLAAGETLSTVGEVYMHGDLVLENNETVGVDIDVKEP